MKANKSPETESFDAAELGAMMREMRENLGHDLETVARDLRIRLVYLEAIEAGRLTDLPGNAYVSGFLRSYSDFLGLEGDEIVRRFKMAGAEISSQPQLHLPSPVEEGRLPTASILLVAAVIAAAAYGGWYYLSSAGKGPIETVASLPKELSGLVDNAKNQTVAKQVAPPSETPASEPTESTATPSDAPETPTESSEPAAASAETPASPPSTESASEMSAPADTASAAPTSPAPASDPVTAESAPAESTPAEPVRAETPTSPAPAETVTPTPAETPAAPVVAVATGPVATPRVEAPVTVAAETPKPATPLVETSTPAVVAVPVETPTPAVVPAEPVRTAAVSPTAPVATPAVTPSASVPEVTTDTPDQTADRTAGGVRIVVRATADSYVAVRTGENEPLFSQLMRRGDSYEVPSGADLVLETGNAGGLQITIGGKRAPSLGPIGEIRRNIPLDAEKLMRGLN
jgi:cytoskeleton protein RodZ